MSLKDEFQEVSGIGPKKAEKLVEIVEQSETESDVKENVKEALSYLDAGRPGYARKFLERVV